MLLLITSNVNRAGNVSTRTEKIKINRYFLFSIKSNTEKFNFI